MKTIMPFIDILVLIASVVALVQISYLYIILHEQPTNFDIYISLVLTISSYNILNKRQQTNE
jgi:hypothetical protein